MSKFSEAELQKALQTVDASGDERTRATRSLTEWNRADSSIVLTEENIRLYCAVRKMNPSGRVSLAQMKSLKRARQRACSFAAIVISVEQLSSVPNPPYGAFVLQRRRILPHGEKQGRPHPFSIFRRDVRSTKKHVTDDRLETPVPAFALLGVLCCAFGRLGFLLLGCGSGVCLRCSRAFSQQRRLVDLEGL